MSEMVERVAKALHDVDPTIYVGDPKMDYYRQAAKVAIEAMRQPTAAMMDADFNLGEDGAHEIWKAMIDGALK